MSKKLNFDLESFSALFLFGALALVFVSPAIILWCCLLKVPSFGADEASTSMFGVLIHAICAVIFPIEISAYTNNKYKSILAFVLYGIAVIITVVCSMLYDNRFCLAIVTIVDTATVVAEIKYKIDNL